MHEQDPPFQTAWLFVLKGMQFLAITHWMLWLQQPAPNGLYLTNASGWNDDVEIKHIEIFCLDWFESFKEKMVLQFEEVAKSFYQAMKGLGRTMQLSFLLKCPLLIGFKMFRNRRGPYHSRDLLPQERWEARDQEALLDHVWALIGGGS